MAKQSNRRSAEGKVVLSYPSYTAGGKDRKIWVPVENIRRYCDPFEADPWTGKGHSFKVDQVWDVVENGKVAKTSYSAMVEDGMVVSDIHWHIQRVAYFVRYGWTEAVELDVGVPHIDCALGWIITDGNHRFAASIVRGDYAIKCTIAGCVETAELLLGVKVRP